MFMNLLLWLLALWLLLSVPFGIGALIVLHVGSKEDDE